MRSLRATAIFFALAVLTAAYCWLAWLGIGVYLVALPQAQDAPWPWITRVVVQDALPFPFHAALMQGVAVLSLLFNFAWGVLRSRIIAGIEAYTLPVLCHVAVILFSVCLLGAGLLAPLLGVAAAIVPT